MVLITFSHHNPKWWDRDLKFFERAQEEEFGFRAQELYKERWQPMFVDDVGDEEDESDGALLVVDATK